MGTFFLFLEFSMKLRASLQELIRKHPFNVILSCFKQMLYNYVFNIYIYIYLHYLLEYVDFSWIIFCQHKLLGCIDQRGFQMFMIFPPQNSKLVYSLKSLSLKPMQCDGSGTWLCLHPNISLIWQIEVNHNLHDSHNILIVSWYILLKNVYSKTSCEQPFVGHPKVLPILSQAQHFEWD